jgi:hypothetical protein
VLSSWDSGAVAPNRGHLTFLLHIPYIYTDNSNSLLANFKVFTC